METVMHVIKSNTEWIKSWLDIVEKISELEGIARKALSKRKHRKKK